MSDLFRQQERVVSSGERTGRRGVTHTAEDNAADPSSSRRRSSRPIGTASAVVDRPPKQSNIGRRTALTIMLTGEEREDGGCWQSGREAGGRKEHRTTQDPGTRDVPEPT